MPASVIFGTFLISIFTLEAFVSTMRETKEATMAPNPTCPPANSVEVKTVFSRLLGGMSVFTMLMTVPQVFTIWVDHQATGVSVVSWSAYFLSAILWFWYGLQKKDKNIYLPCVGWVILDAAVIVGALIYG